MPENPPATTISAIIGHAEQVLEAAGIPTPRVDAALLIGHVLGLGRGEVAAAQITDRAVSAPDLAAIERALERRASREPLQHITGRAGFRRLDLAVGPGVFVPRPETEHVAQFAIDALDADASPSPIGIDLGTGSGAIALALATEVPRAQIYAAEKSAEAFVWAQQNFRETGVSNATLVLADLADAFPELDGRASVVISNPPYVPDEAIPRDPEVRRFDPPAALYGGSDGLDVVRQLSVTAARLLRSGGTLVLEHGEYQGADIRKILDADGWQATATFRDLTLRDRTTTALKSL